MVREIYPHETHTLLQPGPGVVVTILYDDVTIPSDELKSELEEVEVQNPDLVFRMCTKFLALEYTRRLRVVDYPAVAIFVYNEFLITISGQNCQTVEEIIEVVGLALSYIRQESYTFEFEMK